MYKAAPAAYRYFVEHVGEEITPEEFGDFLEAQGAGTYVSQYIWHLRNYMGCKFDVKKEGRRVISYTLVKHPKNVPNNVLVAEEKHLLRQLKDEVAALERSLTGKGKNIEILTNILEHARETRQEISTRKAA